MRPPLDAATRPRLVRGLTIGLSIATVVIGLWVVARHEAAQPAEDDVVALAEGGPGIGADEAADRGAEIDAGVGLAAPRGPVDASDPDALPSSCAALAERARDGGPDAVLLVWLCPEQPIDAVAAREALLEVRSPDEAARLAPRLEEFPDLFGLATLVAQTPVRPAVAVLPDPADAVVSPVDRTVLAQVQRAHTRVAAAGLGPGERTRARALLAKVYLQATQQLGVNVGRPTAPFARLLAGRALHYGRAFCVSYWRRRVAGLSGLFGEVETRLLALVLALEANPYQGDGARLMVELEETRDYLLGDGPRGRIERRLAERATTPWGPDRLLPMPNALDRLIDHGFVDLALWHAIVAAQRPGGPGLHAVELMLRDDLVAAERGEYVALLEHRFAQARARNPGGPGPGEGTIGHAAEVPWRSADAVADEAGAWIDRAPEEDGLGRRYALGRALLVVRPRPDAVAVLIDRATDGSASEGLRRAAGWLAEELAARDDGRRAWQRRIVAAEAEAGPRQPAKSPAERHAQEAARRRSYARALREDGRMPRGAGL